MHARTHVPAPLVCSIPLLHMPPLQVPPNARLACFAALLPAAVEAADGHASALLPRIAVTFVAEQVKVREAAARQGREAFVAQRGPCPVRYAC